MNCSAIIAAAGSGRRMKAEIKKQYIEIGGISILARTAKVFQECPYISEIVIVCNNEDIKYIESDFIKEHKFTKVSSVISGGNERQASVLNGLESIQNKEGIVIIHDGVRPFIDDKNIKKAIDGAQKYDGAILAVPAKDTIKQADSDSFVDKTFNRSLMWQAQTPQAFKYKLIYDAYKKAKADNFMATDDSSIAEHYNLKVKIIEGSYENIKITSPEDLVIAEAILKGYF